MRYTWEKLYVTYAVNDKIKSPHIIREQSITIYNIMKNPIMRHFSESISLLHGSKVR